MSEEPSDEELAIRCTKGERTALSQLVERYHDPLLGYLYRLTDGDHSLAEDLVQETFIRLLRQKSYQPDRPFKPWLYAIATNLARDYFRSPASRQTQSIEKDVFQLELSNASPNPEELAQAADHGNAVMFAV